MRAAAARVAVSVLGGVRGAGTPARAAALQGWQPVSTVPPSRGPLTTLTREKRLQRHLVLEKNAVLTASLKLGRDRLPPFLFFF